MESPKEYEVRITAQHAAARGAEWMDSNKGRWYTKSRVNMNKLDQASPQFSLVTQVTHDVYAEPLLQGRLLEWFLELNTQELRYMFGFCASPPGRYRSRNGYHPKYLEWLTVYWKAEIVSRRIDEANKKYKRRLCLKRDL